MYLTGRSRRASENISEEVCEACVSMCGGTRECGTPHVPRSHVVTLANLFVSLHVVSCREEFASGRHAGVCQAASQLARLDLCCSELVNPLHCRRIWLEENCGVLGSSLSSFCIGILSASVCCGVLQRSTLVSVCW